MLEVAQCRSRSIQGLETYNTMKRATLVSSLLGLSSAKLSEVLTRSWHNVKEELYLDASHRPSTNRNVEVHDRVLRGSLRFHCWAFICDWDVVRLMLRSRVGYGVGLCCLGGSRHLRGFAAFGFFAASATHYEVLDIRGYAVRVGS
jgi:hypothetical protein